MTGAELQALSITLQVALAATALSAGPGIAIGIWLARTRSRFRIAVETAALLPLVVPPVAVGVLLLWLLAPAGPLGSVLRDLFGLQLVLNRTGAAIACSILALPFVVQSVRAAVEGVDPDLEGMARTLGASSWKTLRTVTLPLSWRGVAAGLLLAACRSFGEFGATLVVAGNIPGKTQTLALLMFNLAETGKDRAALRVVGIVSIAAFAAVALASRIRRTTA